MDVLRRELYKTQLLDLDFLSFDKGAKILSNEKRKRMEESVQKRSEQVGVCK